MIGDDVDPEFKELFVEDAATRLNRMSEQLLELERAPGKADLLTSLCREAHSLKGAAGMVGFHEVASVCHALENPLQELVQGQREVTSSLVDALLAGVDGLRSLASAALSTDRAQAAQAATAIIDRLASGVAVGGGPPPQDSLVTNAAPPSAAQPSPETAPAAGAAAESQPRTAQSATMQIAVQRLDEIDRLVGESAAAHLRIGTVLLQELATDPQSVAEYRELGRILTALQELSMRARMVTISTIGPNLHRAVRDVARAGSKSVRWKQEGGETEIDRKILEQLLDPLIHLVRNAVDHGVESPADRRTSGKASEATVFMSAHQRGSEIVIKVSDDGRGIDVAKLRAAAGRAGRDTSTLSEREVENLIFTARLSTADKVTEISGRGVGMDVVRTNVEKLRGRIEVASSPGLGTEFTITVPVTLTIVECMIIESAGQRFALPTASVVTLIPPEAKLQAAAGNKMLIFGDSAVAVAGLAHTLDIGGAELGPYVIVSGAAGTHAFRVHQLIGHRDVVIKALGGLLPKIPAIAGAALEPDGGIVTVLDVDGLVERARHMNAGLLEPEVPSRTPNVLVVEDTMTVRELQRSILERAGYRVSVAANGQEALAMLLKEPSDLVLTDLDMPVMDGIELTDRIRRHRSLGQTPVVILTSHDAESDRQRGLDAGANAYIVKSGFDQQHLLSLVEQLLLGGDA